MYNRRLHLKKPLYSQVAPESARLIQSLFNRDRGTQPNSSHRDYTTGPNLNVKCEVHSNNKYRVAHCSMQGWRLSMEDSLACTLSVHSDPPTSFFGVFDGHGGAQVAKFLKDNLMDEIITKQLHLLKNGRVTEAIRKGYIHTDTIIKKKDSLNPKNVGSTANVVIIHGSHIYCANAGDSRAVASIAGHAAPLSFDHKPDGPEEKRRIDSTGGYVRNGRVNGCLAVSRSFGDFSFKNKPHFNVEYQTVTCYPDITVKDIRPEIEFIIMACDGIWEVKSSQEVINFIRLQLAENIQPDQVLKNLFMDCVASPENNTVAGYDNMSAILICFLVSKPYENFVERCIMPKEVGLDPYVFMMTLESGLCNASSITPHRQRRWGFPHMNSVYQTGINTQYTEILPFGQAPRLSEELFSDTDRLSKLLRRRGIVGENSQNDDDSQNKVEYRYKSPKPHIFTPQEGIPRGKLYDIKQMRKN